MNHKMDHKVSFKVLRYDHQLMTEIEKKGMMMPHMAKKNAINTSDYISEFIKINNEHMQIWQLH